MAETSLCYKSEKTFEKFRKKFKKALAFNDGSIYNIGDVRVSLGKNADSRKEDSERRQGRCRYFWQEKSQENSIRLIE